MKRYFEEGKLDIKWIDNYCKGNYYHCLRREMEEEGKYHHGNILPDGTINKKLKMWKPHGQARGTFPHVELSSTPFGRISIHPRVNPWYSALRVNKSKGNILCTIHIQ
jgi:hypothetical protein